MKARIVENLLDVIEFEMGAVEGHRKDPEFLKLVDRIQGKVVELVFTCGDAFEKQDNNYWLPDSCWEAVGDQPEEQSNECRTTDDKKHYSHTKKWRV